MSAPITTPGALMAALLVAFDMTQADLATAMRRPQQLVSEIRTGKKSVTATTALQLERVFGLPARVWLTLQDEVDLAAAAP